MLLYEPLLAGFAKRGFAVVGVHPIGHGKSPRDLKRYTIKDIVQNGHDAITFASERYSLPIIVMAQAREGLSRQYLPPRMRGLRQRFPIMSL